jgi:ABC-type transport system involved in multi-copper enzyme maturation permease subunit
MSAVLDVKIIARQTSALFLDAYRELNAKRLFWITLWLSLVVVVAFAFISITPHGFTVFGKEFPSYFNSTIVPTETFYKFIFTQYAISWWLGVIALVLALISVASIFPDFISSGSIDLYLARPISRLRLFLTKYFMGLLFVALQVFVFSAASFVLIGIKGHVWEIGIFLAVPIVTLLFSYIYCVCVLLGLLTRSVLAAILVTIIFWIFLFALTTADAFLLVGKTVWKEQRERVSANLATWDKWIGQHKALSLDNQSRDALRNFEFQRERVALEKRDVDATLSQIQFWEGLVHGVRAPLPKTDDTVDLMTRWLVEPDNIIKAVMLSAERQHERRQAWRSVRNRLNNPASTAAVSTQPMAPPQLANTDVDHDDPAVVAKLAQSADSRRAISILGSSVAFEIVILALCAWLFCRRDF